MEQTDEISVCDLCGKQSWFSKCVIYYIDGDPKLLCPACVETKEAANQTLEPTAKAGDLRNIVVGGSV